jgi:hypothetical protein
VPLQRSRDTRRNYCPFVQPERGLRIVDSPGVIFDDDDHI